jgi:hypothetical protein
MLLVYAVAALKSTHTVIKLRYIVINLLNIVVGSLIFVIELGVTDRRAQYYHLISSCKKF